MLRYWLMVSLFVSMTMVSAQAQFRPVATVACGDEYNELQEIVKAPAAAQRIELGQRFLKKYPDSKARGVVYRQLVSALIGEKDFPQAVLVAQCALSEDPGNLTVIAEVCWLASERACNSDLSYATLAGELGRKAIEMINNGSIPYEYNEDTWPKQRENFLGGLHKSLGIVAFHLGQWQEAIEYFRTSTTMLPSDPYSYYLVAKCLYNQTAATEKTAAKVTEKAEANEIILLNLARALVLTEQENYQWLRSSIESEIGYLSQQMKLAKPIDHYVEIVRNELNTTLKTSPKP
ncbi:MAG: hypothetical protein AB1489_25245 [Acidobacteriota bacterium]